MPLLKSSFIVFFLPLIFLSSCSFFSQTDVKTYPSFSSGDTLKIAADQGIFLFTELSLSSTGGSEPRLKGQVVNNTGKDWDHIEFVVDIYDRNGKLLEGGGYYGRYFEFDHFIAGEVRNIGDSKGITIFGFRGKSISRYNLRLGSDLGMKTTQPSMSGQLAMPKSMQEKEKMQENLPSPMPTSQEKEMSWWGRITSVFQADWTGNINFLLGRKYMDSGDWEPVEEQTLFGIDLDFKPSTWPFSIVGGFSQSIGSGKTSNPSQSVDGTTLELSTGARIYSEYAGFPLFLSGGLVNIKTEVESQSFISISQGTGLWGEGGGLWEPFPSLHVGGALKYSYANVEGGANGGGLQFLLLAGWQW